MKCLGKNYCLIGFFQHLFSSFNSFLIPLGGGRCECCVGSGGAAAGGVGGHVGYGVALVLAGGAMAGAAGGSDVGDRDSLVLLCGGGGAVAGTATASTAAASATAAGAAGRPGDGAPHGNGRHESKQHEPGAGGAVDGRTHEDGSAAAAGSRSRRRHRHVRLVGDAAGDQGAAAAHAHGRGEGAAAAAGEQAQVNLVTRSLETATQGVTK